jgi:hypothetical protein
MRILHLRSASIVCLVLGAAHPAFGDSLADTFCSGEKPKSNYFPEMAAAAIEVGRVVCVNGGSQEQVTSAIVAFVESEANKERLRSFGYAADANPLKKVIADIDLATQSIPTITVSLGTALVVNGSSIPPADLAACDARADAMVKGTSCKAALRDFADNYSYAQAGFGARSAIAFSNHIGVLRTEWDEFLTNTRSQTILELALNSYLYRKHESERFTSPPRLQYILLHPAVVIEDVRGALDGEQTQEALMVELAGINGWREKPWYYPTGVSVIALYADRSGNDDVGYGVALHFKGVYTLGYSVHGDEGGIFISGDLLKVFEDKKKVLAAFTR